MESGKSITESRREVKFAASFLEWFSEESKRTFGDVIPIAESNVRRFIVKQPVGVVGLITPWNFPIAMITRKLGAALAAGCTVLIKPAEDTPLSALALAQMADEVGFPPGVINVLPCSRSFASIVGDRFCEDQRIQKISFTGSTEVGKYLMQKCARTVKRTCMERGGSAPFIVFDSADVDIAVKAAMVAKFRNNGQACIGADRFLVQSEIHDVFVNKFCTALQSIVVGSPLDDATTLGTLVNERVLTKVKEHVEDALAKGGTLVAGGTEGRGLVYEPTIVQNCTTDMKIMSEETFGPVAAIMRFDNEEEAIAIANNSKNGLAAYICTSDYRQQWRTGEQIDVGVLGINEGLISADVVPFGGMKESGFGREGSVYGIDEYLEMKYLCFGGMDEGIC